MRSALYLTKRDSFGCEKPDCECPKHLRIDGLGEPDTTLTPRVRHIVRLESMVNVGCKFGPNDLKPDQWRDLIVLAQERNWIDERVQEHREKAREEQAQIDKAMAEARKASGVPSPGQSLFPGKGK
jgi:hypothetical protein